MPKVRVDLNPLLEAFFESEDVEETHLLKEMMDSIEQDSPWVKEMYDNGEASKLLSPTAAKALGEVFEKMAEEEASVIAHQKICWNEKKRN